MVLLHPALHMLSNLLTGPGPAALFCGLWRATWQGALLIAAVYAICRVARRLPASVRCWLWWLASLKMLISLCCLVTIPLAILPSSHLGSAIARTLPAHAKIFIPVGKLAVDKAINPQPVAPEGGVVANLPAVPSPAKAPSPAPRRLSVSVWTLPLALWTLGLALITLCALRAIFDVHRLVQEASHAEDTDLALAQLMAKRVGLRRLPRIVRSPAAQSVFVTGFLRSTIVLPDAQWSELTEDEALMALAHEMAHLRRADLWLGLGPSIAKLLFFFHPLMWLAAREYNACREEACDLIALRATGLSAMGFARLLVKMAEHRPTRSLTHAAGLSPAYRAMRRRLETVAASSVAVQRLRPGARLALALVVVVLCALLLPWHLVAARHLHPMDENPSPSFVLSDLGTGGSGQIAAVAMNDQGQVIATSEAHDGNVSYAYVLANASSYSLGGLPRYAYCRASAVNNTGAVAASSYNLYDHNHAFIWRGGGKTRLSGLPGFHFTKALAINDTDQVVGYVENGKYRDGERKSKAALWNGGANWARALNLGTLGGRYSEALAINNLGQVVGKADTASPRVTHACLWEDGATIDLGALPGGTNSLAKAINNHGVVVGCSETTGAPHAFLWADNPSADDQQQGQMRDLGTLPGGISSQASAVNDSGEAVGQAMVQGKSGPATHAVVWQNGHIYDLNNLVHAPGWVLQSACAITSGGQIAGVGLYQGKPRVFVLTPKLPLADLPVSRI